MLKKNVGFDFILQKIEMILGFDVVTVDGPDVYFNDVLVESFPHLEDGK